MLLAVVQPENNSALGKAQRNHPRSYKRSKHLAALTGEHSAENDSWVIEYVDSSIELGGMSERSLQLDAQGHPRIAYGGDSLYYAWYDGANWIIEAVDTGSPDVRYVSLALDTAGFVHIGYYDQADDAIKYAFQTESGWQYQVIARDAGLDCSSISALVLDEGGNPKISYGGNSLNYAHLVSNTWQIIKIVDEGNIAFDPSLALDSQGLPHISYSLREGCGFGYFYSDLQYAYADSAGWKTETVYAGTSEHLWAGGSSLVIDWNNQSHISYFVADFLSAYTIGSLQYAIRSDTGWQIETVSDVYARSISLAVDRNGSPHISYIIDHVKSYGADLMYAYLDEGVWHTQTIMANDQGWVVFYSSITLDEDDDPHISYLNHNYAENNYLTYTYQSPGVIWPIKRLGVGLPGSTIPYTLQVLNTTQLTDTLDVSVSGYDWPTILPSTVGPLAPAESAALNVSVTIPATVTLGSTDTVTITVTSQEDSSRTGSAILTTFAGHVFFMPLIEK
jgi:hypothetical protein